MSKNPDAFRTISEVADELELPQHVLRFWETRFTQIKPMKRGGGRRYYRPEDIDLLRGIKGLLYEEGYTIRGVQRLLKEQGNSIAIEFGKGQQTIDTLVSQTAAQHQIAEADTAPISSNSGSVADAKPKNLLHRLAGRVGTSKQEDDSLNHMDGLKILEATLQELLECKRLLDQTRQK